MVAVVRSSTLVGIDAVAVEVECDVARGQLPSYSVVGLAAPSVKEGAVRIRSALNTVGHDLPLKKVVVNLAPADLRKPGSALDLPIALSVLVAEGMYDGGVIDRLIVLGELGLDGTVRPVRGVLAAAMLARERGMRGVLVPAKSAGEARVVGDLEVYGVEHLAEVIAALAGRGELPASGPKARRKKPAEVHDMAEVRGQHAARLALEIAVAGGHNLLLAGPPGTGKTMLAKRIPGILPPMTRDEALETTKIHSAAGVADGLIEVRPFRAPHHTISEVALIGGGSQPRPGEISLAHNGVLFLDELPEFTRKAIECLRQPLEERAVMIGRIRKSLWAPASFLMVAAANPCPCGYLGSLVRECVCSQSAVERYRTRMSGPLLDRIDLRVQVDPVPLSELRNPVASEASAVVRDRVIAARDRQRARLGRYGIRTNAEMTSRVLRATCPLDATCERTLSELIDSRVSARSIDRVIKVARTVADLTGLDAIDPECLREAAGFRGGGELS